MESFFALSKSRQYNQAGLQPLQPSEIASHLWIHGVSEVEQKVEFEVLMMRMDDTFMEHQFKQQEQRSNSQR